MKKINLFIALVMLVGSTIVFTSCKKDSESTAVDTSSASDETLADRIYENVSNISDEAYALKSSNLKSTETNRLFLGDCAVITLDTLAFPLTMTIDFGEENCLCDDGHYRRGQIQVSFTGRYRAEGTVITHGFNNYFVDDNRVEGTKVVTNMGLNTDSHFVYQIEVVGVIFLANTDDSFSWNSSRTREWVEGADTYTLWDDVYLISGNSEGVRADGETWQRITLEPLRKELGCRHIVSGIIEITPAERPIRTLDYGSGDCDNVATVTVNGVIYTIMLP